MLLRATLLVSATLALAACGNSPGERGLTGAGIGAAGGAGVAALTGGNAGTGAIIGGLAGGATGALTDRRDIDLGDSPF